MRWNETRNTTTPTKKAADAFNINKILLNYISNINIGTAYEHATTPLNQPAAPHSSAQPPRSAHMCRHRSHIRLSQQIACAHAQTHALWRNDNITNKIMLIDICVCAFVSFFTSRSRFNVARIVVVVVFGWCCALCFSSQFAYLFIRILIFLLVYYWLAGNMVVASMRSLPMPIIMNTSTTTITYNNKNTLMYVHVSQ